MRVAALVVAAGLFWIPSAFAAFDSGQNPKLSGGTRGFNQLPIRKKPSRRAERPSSAAKDLCSISDKI
jgi:hypothetical protein